MTSRNHAQTEYGLLERRDGQPIQNIEDQGQRLWNGGEMTLG